MLLIPLLIALWQVLRSPDVRARLHPDRAQQIYLRDLQKRLAALKLKRAPDETVNAFALRIAERCGKDHNPLFEKRRVIYIANAVNAFLYGGKPLSCQEIRQSERRVTSVTPLLRRLLYYVTR